MVATSKALQSGQKESLAMGHPLPTEKYFCELNSSCIIKFAWKH